LFEIDYKIGNKIRINAVEHFKFDFQTYNCDSQTADSASTATALFSGIKTNINTLGFDSGIEFDDPASELSANKVETILKWAQDADMDTG
jgi:alkaline phosphatase